MRLFLPLVSVLAAALVVTAPAYAQPCPFAPEDAIADTLDPAGYYPLGLGDRWEYAQFSGAWLVALHTREVVADTLIGGEPFAVLRTVRMPAERDRRTVLRSDTSFAYEAVRGGVPVRWDPSTGEVEPLEVAHRLDAPFRSCYDSSPGFDDDSVQVLGRDTTVSFRGPVVVEVPAVKEFLYLGMFTWEYAYGLGLYRRGGEISELLDLAYARVGIAEYGTPLDSTYNIRVSMREDSLDWRRYFPLEVGNEWHYRSGYDAPAPDLALSDDIFFAWRVRADTVVGDQRYFALEETQFDVYRTPTSETTHLVRYDTLLATVVVSREGLGGEDELWKLPCRLDAPLETDSGCVSDGLALTYFVTGGVGDPPYEIAPGEPLEADRWKVFQTLGGSQTLASDVGLIEVGVEASSFRTALIYAQVSGRTYGSEALPTNVESEALAAQGVRIEGVYPNPATTSATILYYQSHPIPATLEVFNMLGRLVHQERLHAQIAGLQTVHWRPHGLSPGLYFIRIQATQASSLHALTILP